MSNICAIHQPNFFPWRGYFDKIKKSDVFVFLDHVQIPKKGGSWVNRVKMNCFGTEKWVSCPIKRPNGLVNINEAEFSKDNWQDDFLEIIHNYYRKYPHYNEIYSLISKILSKEKESNLSDLNCNMIKNLCRHMNIDCQFIKSSDLNITTHSTQMLIDICQKLDAKTYLCGGGAQGYLEEELFVKQGIHLRYQNFQPTPYGNNYLPGLSVIDYLMSEKQ